MTSSRQVRPVTGQIRNGRVPNFNALYVTKTLAVFFISSSIAEIKNPLAFDVFASDGEFATAQCNPCSGLVSKQPEIADQGYADAAERLNVVYPTNHLRTLRAASTKNEVDSYTAPTGEAHKRIRSNQGQAG
jgi:hypothetical protein